MMTQMNLYLISDAVGETAHQVTAATLLQFPNVTPHVRTFPFVNDFEELKQIMLEAKAQQAIVVLTLVTPELVQWAQKFATEQKIPLIDYMSPLTKSIEQLTGQTPLRKPGMRHAINQEYFDQMAAVDFAVAHDDGQNIQTFGEADIVVLGVSRTSKTPISMYLANQRLKVANLPLIPGTPVPDTIYQLKQVHFVGLTIQPERLAAVRKTRMAAIGLPSPNHYTDLSAIDTELAQAKQVFRKLKIQPIDMTNRSVEEASALIMEQMAD